MEVTEVRIKLMEEAGERLQAFCSITLDDCFVVRDLKIIDGTNGPFVAMPSRKLTAHCPQCGCKNYLRAAYCNQCGLRLSQDRAAKDDEGRTKLYADIAHPINSACRESIQARVIAEFQAELVRAKQPGYVSRYDDFDQEDAVAQPLKPARGDAPPPSKRTVSPTTQIQPAEAQPRPPHLPAARRPAPSQPAAEPKREFGSGLL